MKLSVTGSEFAAPGPGNLHVTAPPDDCQPVIGYLLYRPVLHTPLPVQFDVASRAIRGLIPA